MVTEVVSPQHYARHLLLCSTLKGKYVMQFWKDMRVSTVNDDTTFIFWVNLLNVILFKPVASYTGRILLHASSRN